MSFPSSSVFGFFSPRLYSELLESCEGPGKPEPVVSRGWSVAPVVGGGRQGPNKGKKSCKETTNCQNDSSSRKALKMRPVQRVSAYSPSHEPDKARERG